MEKELSASSGLTLGESPQHAASPRCSLFRRSKRTTDSVSRLSATPEDRRLARHLNSKSCSSKSTTTSSRRPLALPHTITERHGGQELWVKAPVVSGSLEKQGFRWRKKWKLRFVELDGRQLAYYEDSSAFSATTATASGTKRNSKPKRKVMLTADAALEDLDETTLCITPALEEKPWMLRARDAATKQRWLVALSDCIDILVWLRHYKLGAVLGVGGNGVVQKLQDERDGTLYAVKVLDVAKFRHREQVVAEVEILRNITNNIKHPNLITIHKVYEEHQKVYIIQEMCTGGELYDRVVQRGKYSERDAANIMSQLVSALQALHAHNILHLDIKPENILFSSEDPDSKILLTDFGLARMINGKQNPLDQGKSMAGTIGYMAPEVISSHVYSEAADVFSAGVILFILLVGYPPFFGDSEVEILLKIARGDFTFDPQDWAHVSGSAKELVARMLEVRAQDRITIDEVLTHPWITREVDHRGGDREEDRDLSASMMTKLQRFNIDRKSQNMGSFMASILFDDNEADFMALVDEATIEMMIRQLCVEGQSRIPLRGAHVIAKGLGLSSYIDEKSFVQFLDQDNDGFINASDFCAGVKALRNHHESFASMVFSAIRKMNSLEEKSDSDEEAAVLAREHFATAFSMLECPEPLVEVFFKYVDEEEEKQFAAKTPDDSSTSTFSSWSVNEAEFATLFTQFSFIGMLFLRTAKDNVVSMVKSHSVDGMPRISEDSYSFSSP
ncbi:Calcium-dependent protein kinase 2 [Phytophthora citrophthora]|uniref:Calcium-dependent protein kinase 2 n=1 Tax=Phytophthora citrophthora TaxID=4793 RepID=A0AAD9GTX9_9STRA|nr:Calcium-dependent protein kinase 2 [Phytophthora citrophthora]